MFTTLHDGKIYLDDLALTYLMADEVNTKVNQLNEPILNCFGIDPQLHVDLSNQIVDEFKQTWRRPRDGSNADIKDMHRSVPDAVLYSVGRQLEEFRLASVEQAHEALLDPESLEGYRRLLNEIFPEEERG